MMKLLLFFCPVTALSFLFLMMLPGASAQTGTPAPLTLSSVEEKGVFDSDEILQITLKGNIRDVLKDKTGRPKNFPLDLLYTKYNRLKNDIYNLYTSCTLLKASYVKSTIGYLDEFYKTINNPALWRKDFAYPCDKNGTGNVVIRGLKDE